MTTPTSREALDRVLKGERRSLHTSFPAKVLAYDAAAQTLDVEPQLMRELEDDQGAITHEQLPDLYDVPVQWPRAGKFAITFPIRPGDFVEVQCAEQSTLNWRDSGAVSEPGISQPHGLNGCIAKPGWYPDTQKLEGVSATDLVIGKEDGSSTIRIQPDGTIVLGGEAGAQFVALAERVDAEFGRLWTLLSGEGVPPSKWIKVAQDGGAALQAAALSAKKAVLSVKATKVKAV